MTTPEAPAVPASDHWDMEDVIDAHGLPHRVAMALLQIAECVETVDGGVHNIKAALWHLRRLRADPGLRINAWGAVPADPDRAEIMTFDAVAAELGIEDDNLHAALACLIPDTREFSSVATLTDDLDHAIASLDDYNTIRSAANDDAPENGYA